MAEVIIDFKAKVDQALQGIKNVRQSLVDVEVQADKTGKSIADDFNKGSDGAKRLQQELSKQPKTLADLELRLIRLRELLRDDTRIGTEGFKQVSAAIKNTEKAIDQANGKIDQQKRKFVDFNAQIKQIGASIIAAFAVQRIVDFGVESIKLAAKAEGVKIAFDRINDPLLLDNLRKATRGTVSDLTLMQQAVRAENFKIPLEQMGVLLEFARRRAKETGVEIDYLVESIINGIGRKSILVLDNLGISSTALKEELGGAAVQAQSIGTISEAVGRIAQRELEKMGDEAITTADKIAQLDTDWQNLKVTIGNTLIDGLNFFSSFSIEGGAPALSKEQVEEAVRNLDAQRRGFKNAKEELEAYTFSLRALATAQDLISGSKELEQLFDGAMAALENSNKTLEKLRLTLSEYQEELEITTINSFRYQQLLHLIKNREDEITIALGKETEAMKKKREEVEKLTKKVEDLIKAEKESAESPVKLEGEESPFTIATEPLDIIDQLHEEELLRLEAIERRKKAEEELTQWLSEEEQKRLDKMREEIDAIASFSIQLVGLIQSQQRAQADFELSILQDQLSEKLITDEQYAKKRKQILHDQAVRDKEAAIFETTINLAVAISKAFTKDQTGVLAALNAALIGAELATIVATPIPEFAKGTDYVKGGIKGKDSVHAMLMPGEAVITYTKNAQYKGLSKAINEGRVDDWLIGGGIKHFPKFGELAEKAMFAERVAASTGLNFSDKGIRKDLQKLRSSEFEAAEYTAMLIVKGLKGKSRGGYHA